MPSSVVDRIKMTRGENGELERSGVTRMELWNEAIEVFKENPVFGVGYGGFGLTIPKDQLLTDTHNYYVKMLAEQGIVGFFIINYHFWKSL